MLATQQSQIYDVIHKYSTSVSYRVLQVFLPAYVEDSSVYFSFKTKKTSEDRGDKGNRVGSNSRWPGRTRLSAWQSNPLTNNKNCWLYETHHLFSRYLQLIIVFWKAKKLRYFPSRVPYSLLSTSLVDIWCPWTYVIFEHLICFLYSLLVLRFLVVFSVVVSDWRRGLNMNLITRTSALEVLG